MKLDCVQELRVQELFELPLLAWAACLAACTDGAADDSRTAAATVSTATSTMPWGDCYGQGQHTENQNGHIGGRQ